VAEAFARDGHEVVVYDNLSRARMLGKSVGDPEHNWKYLGSLGNVTRIRGDVRDFAALAEAARGADIMVHAAAQVAVTTSLENPREDFEVNALGTFNVLEAARREDSALLFLSTNKVYGENVNSIPVRELETRYEFADPRYEHGIPEELPVDHTGHTPYGSSKLAADIYVQEYHHTYGLRTGVFRMSCIYGTRQFGVEDQGCRLVRNSGGHREDDHHLRGREAGEGRAVRGRPRRRGEEVRGIECQRGLQHRGRAREHSLAPGAPVDPRGHGAEAELQVLRLEAGRPEGLRVGRAQGGEGAGLEAQNRPEGGRG
jgi:NAD(P)-dependent dehydrogenase (short-subunit alcohol dehydrogenase family)